MVGGDENTWNLRDSHMADCLKSLIDFHVSSEVDCFILFFGLMCVCVRPTCGMCGLKSLIDFHVSSEVDCFVLFFGLICVCVRPWCADTCGMCLWLEVTHRLSCK